MPGTIIHHHFAPGENEIAWMDSVRQSFPRCVFEPGVVWENSIGRHVEIYVTGDRRDLVEVWLFLG